MLPCERPLPGTFALTASVFHMIEHHDPVAIVGYMFHLEYTATQLGAQYVRALKEAGLPQESMTFLAEHAEVDEAHCKLIEDYCRTLLCSADRLEAALYMQRMTAQLYARMLDEALDTAETWCELASRTEPCPTALLR